MKTHACVNIYTSEARFSPNAPRTRYMHTPQTFSQRDLGYANVFPKHVEYRITQSTQTLPIAGGHLELRSAAAIPIGFGITHVLPS